MAELKHVGVDEKAVANGHACLTVVANLNRAGFCARRKGESLDGF